MKMNIIQIKNEFLFYFFLNIRQLEYYFRFRYVLKCLINFYVQKTSSISRINCFHTLNDSEFSIAPLKVSPHSQERVQKISTFSQNIISKIQYFFKNNVHSTTKIKTTQNQRDAHSATFNLIFAQDRVPFLYFVSEAHIRCHTCV